MPPFASNFFPANHSQLVHKLNLSHATGDQQKEKKQTSPGQPPQNVGMNRDFVYNIHDDRPSVWSRTSSTLNKWLWGALCCGVPGAPCYFCTCCARLDDSRDRERSRVNQSTGTVAERIARPHRPHAPGGRKSTPEMLSAVRCALSQLQGEPAPPLPAKTSETRSKAEPAAVDQQ